MKTITSIDEYRPTISRKRLRNMTMVTRKNEAKVMGDINRFFAHHDVRILNGYAPHVIGVEKVVIEEATEYSPAVTFERKLYSKELYPVYLPYVGGYCHQHYMRNEKDRFCPQVLLSVSTKYAENCVPVSVGDKYKILGNRLIIMHQPDDFCRNTPWRCFNEFIYDDHVSDAEILEAQIRGVCATETADSYAFSETAYSNAGFDASIYEGNANTICEWIYDSIRSAMTAKANDHNSQDTFEYVYKSDDESAHTLKLTVDPGKALDPKNHESSVEYVVDDEEKDCGIYHVLCVLSGFDDYLERQARRYQCQDEAELDDDFLDYFDDLIDDCE